MLSPPGFGPLKSDKFPGNFPTAGNFPTRRLTERTPEFFDETVGRHLESLETELAALQRDAEKLAGEIEELTGEPAALGLNSGPCAMGLKNPSV